MCTVRRGTAVAANAPGTGATGRHALNRDSKPLANAVSRIFEIALPAVIGGEEKFSGTEYIHGTEYRAELRSCKFPKLRCRRAISTIDQNVLATNSRYLASQQGFFYRHIYAFVNI